MANVQLQKLLQSKQVDKKHPFNYIQMGDVSGRYYIDAYVEPAFWGMYAKTIASGHHVCMAECPLPESILRLDVDISIVNQCYIDEDKEDKCVEANLCYSKEQVYRVVNIANNILRSLACDVTTLDCTTLLLEKSAKIIDSGNNMRRVKRGFHLHWPFVVLKECDAKEWLRQLINEIANEEIFDLEKSPIDTNTFGVPWLLYGSRKAEDRNSAIRNEPYLISIAWDSNGNEVAAEQVLDQVQLVDIYDENKIIVDAPIEWRMSIRPHGRKVTQCRVILQQFCEPIIKSYVALPNNVPINLQHVQELLGMLCIERCRDYKQWINVGRCVYSITHGTLEGLQMWTDWSMNCVEKFSNAVCQSKWRTFTTGTCGIGLLKNWAKTDNMHAYSAWKEKIFTESLLALRFVTSGEIARIAASIIGEHYKYFNEEWFCFSEHHWTSYLESGEGEIPLYKILNTKVKEYIDKTKLSLDQNDVNYEQNVKYFDIILRKLDEPASLKSIVAMMKLEYYDKQFKSKLNTNPLTIGLQNGVYDLDKCVFRDGRQEDYISLTLNCKYIEYDMNSPEIKNIERQMIRFFPNTARRKYMLDVLCQVFVGNLYLKHLFFWVGSGDNGKTAFSRMMEEMLGTDYCVKLPTTLLTSAKSDVGKAAPELCQLRGKRLALFDEPDHSETLSNGTLKILTGRDSLAPRELFEKGKNIKSFIPLCQYVFVCNREPNVKNPDDNALWERFRVCEFESCFTQPDKAPATFEQQVAEKTFPKDPNFVNNVRDLNAPLCYYLLQHWKATKGKNLDTPACILKATQTYRDSANSILTFIEADMEKDTQCSIPILEFLEKFRNYLSTLPYKTKSLNTSKIIEVLRQIGIDVTQNGIVGYKFKSFV